jgi:hypothetical protein
LDLNLSTAEPIPHHRVKNSSGPANATDNLNPFTLSDQAYELGMWLRALRSFFNLRHHPLGEVEQTRVTEREWTNETALARRALLRCAQLMHSMAAQDTSAALFEQSETLATLSSDSRADLRSSIDAAASRQSLVDLSEALGTICTLGEALLETRAINFNTWTSFGSLLMRELDRSDIAQGLMQTTYQRAAANLPVPLLELTRKAKAPAALLADLLIIFNDLSRLLEYLRFIEASLKRDHPLKQTLPLFTLVHEEAQTLLDFIETRALRTEGLDQPIFDALDGTQYVIAMELRKVFTRELPGLCELHQAPPIYVKIENAHGLLHDCFQQSIVGLAQLFEPSLDNARLFDSFRTKLDQSLLLRRDLWILLQHVQRAKDERELYPVAQLLEHLKTFREGSLRYLMYKDWEACERFMEEVTAARGAAELAPVLHRFATYLQTLHEHVNMRAVLADHPFDYPRPDQ